MAVELCILGAGIAQVGAGNAFTASVERCLRQATVLTSRLVVYTADFRRRCYRSRTTRSKDFRSDNRRAVHCRTAAHAQSRGDEDLQSGATALWGDGESDEYSGCCILLGRGQATGDLPGSALGEVDSQPRHRAYAQAGLVGGDSRKGWAHGFAQNHAHRENVVRKSNPSVAAGAGASDRVVGRA